MVFAVPCAVLVWGYEGDRLFANIAKLFAAWFGSWLIMWAYKQLFAAFVSGGAELAATFESVAFRFGVGGYKDATVSYSVKDAFYRVWNHISDISLKWALTAGLLIVLGLFAFSRLRHGRKDRLYGFLALAALPLLWMAATTQPIYIHYWFQYRSLYVCFFALMLYSMEALGLDRKTCPVSRFLWKS